MLHEETQVFGADNPPASTEEAKGWDAPYQEPKVTLSAQDRAEWLDIRAMVQMLAASESWSMGEVARRSGVGMGVLSPWYSGKYKGSYPETTKKLKRWVLADEERRAYVPLLAKPGFVRTPTAERVLEALLVAQEAPGIAVVTLGPGQGKTSTIEHVLATRPHTYAITASPSVSKASKVNRVLAHRLDITAHAGRFRELIGEALKRASHHPLLMVDEAQYLADDAVHELRHYLDEYQCGLALLGNKDVITRWGAQRAPREGYGQWHRRITYRIDEARPAPGDIEAYVAAWGIEDPEIMRLMRVLGQKPGALGQIAETLKVAAIRLRGAKRALTPEDVIWAWNARGDLGGLR